MTDLNWQEPEDEALVQQNKLGRRVHKTPFETRKVPINYRNRLCKGKTTARWQEKAARVQKRSNTHDKVIDLRVFTVLNLDRIEEYGTVTGKKENMTASRAEETLSPHVPGLEDLAEIEPPMIITDTTSEGEVKLIPNSPGITGTVKKEAL